MSAKKDSALDKVSELVEQRLRMEKQVEQVTAELGNCQPQVEELAYLAATRGTETDKSKLTEAQDRIAALEGRLSELGAAVKGAAREEEKAKSALRDYERQCDQERLGVILKEVPKLSGSLPKRIEELAITLERTVDLEKEARAIAGRLGIQLVRRDTVHSVWTLTNARMAKATSWNFGPSCPAWGIPKAEQSLQEPWEVRK